MTPHMTALKSECSTPVVSIIIPTHNRAEMLRRAIRSVLAQTWQGDFEVIVISDGSTDNTEDAVKSFQDPRILLLKHESSRGASAARNTGLRECRGEYIAFLDDDDEWTPNKLDIQMPAIENSGPEVGLVYAWMEYFYGGKSIRIHAPELRGNVFIEMLDKQAIGGCPTIIIKRTILNKIGFFDESLPRGNDGDYWRRISQHYHVDFVPKILAKIHIGHGVRISTDSRKGLLNEIYALKTRLETFKTTFEENPDKKTSVLMKIGVDYILTGHICKGLSHMQRGLLTGCHFHTKGYYLFENVKLVLRGLVNMYIGRYV